MKRHPFTTGLLLCVVLLSLLIPFVSPGYPLLGHILGLASMLTSLCLSIFFLVVGVRRMIIKNMQNIHWRRIWRRIWRFWPKREKKKADGVSTRELVDLCVQAQEIRLALFGMTPEQEEVRCQYYQQRNQPLPELILPQRNAALYADYVRFTAVMDLMGFPEVGRLSIHSETFAFLKTWADDLQQRISHVHLPAIVAAQLERLIKESQELFATYPSAATTPAYFRVIGAVAFLERIAQDGRVPVEVLEYGTQGLTRDLSTLRQQLHQANVALLTSHS